MEVGKILRRPIQLRPQNLLGNKDVKKLRMNMQKTYDEIGSGRISVEEVVPPEVRVAKIPQTKILVYFVQNQPVFFEVDNQLIPTVYTLWKFPSLIWSFVTYSTVSTYVLKGADLMLPGLVHPKGGFMDIKKGDICCIRVLQNQYPFSVGKCLMDSNQLNMIGLKGKCVECYHTFGDALWQLGNKIVPSPSFTLEEIKSNNYEGEHYEISESQNNEYDSGISDDFQNNNNDDDEINELDASENEVNKLCGQIMEDMSLEDNENPETNTTISQESMNIIQLKPEQMDEVLNICLLGVLSSLNDDQLPLDISALYGKMVTEGSSIVSNPQMQDHLERMGVCIKEILESVSSGKSEFQVDVKKSSHKKLSKFIQAKLKEKLFRTKLARGTIHVTYVDRMHPNLIKYESNQKLRSKIDLSKSYESHLKGSPNIIEESDKIEVKEVYQIRECHYPIFTAVNVSYGKNIFFTSKECRNVLDRYIKEILKKDVDEEYIFLDSHLTRALLGKTECIEKLHTSEVFPRFQSKMQIYYAVVHSNRNTVEPVKYNHGPCPTVRISVENRGGRKHVTHISSLMTFVDDLSGVAEYMQKKLACASATYEIPGKNKELGVMVQGNVALQVAEILTSKYSVPKKYVEIVQKKK